MKPDQLYQHLKELAEKLGIHVSDESFRKNGIRVQSGHCVVKGEKMFIIDRHMKINDKVELLATFLSTIAHEDIYVMPVVRDILQKYSPSSETEEGSDDPATESVI